MGAHFPNSLGRLVAERAAATPDGLAYTFSTRRGAERVAVTYGELAQRAGHIAAGLRARAEQGSVVACALPPGPDFIAAFCGAAWAGMISIPMAPPPLGGDRSGFDHILWQSRAKFVIAEETARLRLQGEKRRAPIWLSLPDLENDALPPSPADGGVAYLQYTSGSTGRPKGVMITHANVLDNCVRIRDRFGHSEQSVGVIWLPPYHDMGLVGGILQPLFVGFPVHLFSPQDFIRSPLTWLRMISELGATTSGGPNFAYEACVRRITEEQREGLDLSTWRVAFTGAEPIDPATLERFGAAYAPHGFRSSAFYPCYGLGEATLMVTGGRQGEGAHAVEIAALGPERRSLVECGDVVDDHDLKVVDPRSRRPIADGELGEVWVSGPSVAAGYWRNAKATHRTFSARLRDGRGPYLRTGDLGRIIAGRLIVSGRLKASVVVRGVNHQLEDIERTVMSSHPDLAAFQCAACVSDLEELHILQEAPAMTDSLLGELRATISASVIQMHGIAPAAVTFLRPGRLPRTTSGKVRREDARHLAEAVAK